jgi:N-acetylglucosaminyl-diphospho-decaprenol L-rhamnosyltransferase
LHTGTEPKTSQALATLDAVTVIVVTYQSAHCIESLATSLAQLPQVVIVDNASTDGTASAVQRHMPNATLLRNDANIGFGRANNKGLEAAQTPYALLLNPDCEIDAQAIAALVDSAQRWPTAAMIAPQILTPSGKPELNYRWPSTHWPSTGPGATADCCVGFVCGAAILLNLDNMHHVGGFDPDFFLYYEDDDLCCRTFAAHKPMMLIPSITVTHRSRGSVGGAAPLAAEYTRGYFHAQSKIRFTAKHHGAAHSERLRRKTLRLAYLSLALRLLWPSPKHLARNWGRVRGLREWQTL